ncbi:hypothetical protein [Phenylobacterium sp.]|jgi:hypothetical protein|uniref:hypothetical protein n=1 Tax=Phenylobacterium sp. TaxID=1871053 RepID=UPI002F42AEBB
MKLTIAITLAALAVAGSAFAQAPGGGGGGGGASPEMQAARQAMMQACAADQKSLCADKQGREAMMCLMRDNADKVSQGCKDAMAKMRAARQGGAGGGSH